LHKKTCQTTNQNTYRPDHGKNQNRHHKHTDERDIVLANIWVSLAAVREGCGDINGAIAAREKVEFLFHDFQEPNDDHKEQREINQTGLMRLYSLVDK
jgi:hypothetical protein